MSRFLVHHSMWADPRMVGLSPEASALWLRAGSWAAGHHTDGFVPDDAIPQIGGHAAAGELVRRGLFDRLGISRNRVSQIEADSPTSITDVGEGTRGRRLADRRLACRRRPARAATGGRW